MLRNSLNIQLGKLLFTLIISILIVSCGGGSGNNSQTSAVSIITGVAQKGPFSIDSAVTITALDSNGNAASEPIKTIIDGNSGKFTFEISESSSASFYRMTATGKVFDESNGSVLEDPIKLSSITDNLNEISINVLTHWISQRTDSLVIGGKSFQASLNQSQKELFDIFGIDNPNALDLIDSSSVSKEGNAMLLLLSGSLMEVISEYNVDTQTVINEIGNDFLDDGKLSEKGDDWFVRAQAIIKNNPSFHTQKYAKNLRDKFGFNISAAKNLPAVIPLASRPVANIPPELLAEPGETIILDGSSSNDGGDIINFTWFRVDQQTQYDIQVSDRFSAAPFITLPDEATVLAAPNQEISLLYALVVTDVDKLTDTSVVKVTVKIPPQNNNPPVAGSQSLVTDEDTPIAITLSASDVDGDQINFILSTPLATANGIVELDSNLPNIVYTPTSDYSGPDSFTFIVNDGFENSNTATIDIEINPVNDPPIADAGIDQVIGSLETVTLDGSDSADIDGTIDSYLWTPQINNIPVTINGIDSSNPTFIAPDVFAPESLFFDLVVSDNNGIDSIADTVEILVNPTGIPPVATDVTIQLSSTGVPTDITLIGDDPDGDNALITYEILTLPSSGSGVTLGEIPNLGKIVSYLPNNTNTPVADTFRYRVIDERGFVSNTATVNLDVANQPPTAVAEFVGNPPVLEFDQVQLSGVQSSDTDGTIVSYLWEQIGTPAITFSNNAIVNPTFAAPEIPLSGGGGGPVVITPSPITLVFNLIVTDDDGATNTDTVNIVVNPIPNTKPIADAGDPQSIRVITTNVGSVDTEYSADFVLDGSGSSDAEDNIADLTFNWTFVSGPTNLSDPANVISPSININSLNVNIDGDYVFRLVVTDRDGEPSDPDDVTITLGPNLPPTAADVFIPIDLSNATTSITLSGNDPDGDNADLIYEILTLPSTGRLLDIGDQAISVGLIIGTDVKYESNSVSSPDPDSFTYRVTDPEGLISNIATVNLTEPNTPPRARAGFSRIFAILGLNDGANSVEESTFRLDGSLSSDAEDARIDLTYEWRQVSGPVTIPLGDIPQIVKPIFVLSSSTLGSLEGVYEFELTVTDTGGLSSTETVGMTLQPPGPGNTADPGVDRDVIELTTVQVYGQATPFDIPMGDNSISRWEWTQIDIIPGTEVELVFDPVFEQGTPTFIAPAVTGPTPIRFRLVVYDRLNNPPSIPVFVTYTVYPTGTVLANEKPTALDQNISMNANGSGKLFQLIGFGDDPDGDNLGLTYEIIGFNDPGQGLNDPSQGSIRSQIRDFVYTPVYSSTNPVVENSLTYVAIDQDGAESDPATITFTPIVSPTGNTAPVAQDITLNIDPPLTSSNSRQLLSYDLMIQDAENDRYVINEISKNDLEVSFSLLSGNLRMDNRNRSTAGTGTFEYQAIDIYGNASNTATITINYND